MAVTAERLLDEHELAEAGPPEAIRLPLDLVDPHPNNPRQRYDELDELAQNIHQFGLLQPITVRRMGDRYEVLGGHRRRAAFLLLRDSEPHDPQWRTIPAVVRNADDDRAFLMLLSSQVHTRHWRPREEAAALERLAADGLTLKQIGERLQRTESWASKRLRVYADAVLSGYVQTMRQTPKGEKPLLDAVVAEILLSIKDPGMRKQFAELAIKNDWSQDDTRAEIRKHVHERAIRGISKIARELLDLLSSVDSSRIPIETARDLWTLHGRIEVMGRGSDEGKVRKLRVPTIEEAQRAAGVKTQERKQKPGTRRKPGLTFRQSKRS